ncbi:hypothetical protein NRIC_14680 [Enterococcus florum]|uniref:Uncharacterized protein n=1 Tax=Enterococcus florum TaxID=2480627 RepID=A0A4P5P6N0_9ENTE|nr:hypothetical protein [Enterococcus florum]GCF93577.1 hypothetical protein NRIC_14680 [Enterococcus florum]
MNHMHTFNPQLVAETGEYQIFYDVDGKIGNMATEDVGKAMVKVSNQVCDKKAKIAYIDVKDFLD